MKVFNYLSSISVQINITHFFIQIRQWSASIRIKMNTCKPLLSFSRSLLRSKHFGGIQSARCLSLHEYLSFEVLREKGLTLPNAQVASSPAEAKSIASKFLSENSIDEYVVKAQVLAGGRGKGSFVPSNLQGGVKLAFSPDEVESISSQMLNNTLVTKQTGAKGELKTNAGIIAGWKLKV